MITLLVGEEVKHFWSILRNTACFLLSALPFDLIRLETPKLSGLTGEVLKSLICSGE